MNNNQIKLRIKELIKIRTELKEVELWGRAEAETYGDIIEELEADNLGPAADGINLFFREVSYSGFYNPISLERIRLKSLSDLLG